MTDAKPLPRSVKLYIGGALIETSFDPEELQRLLNDWKSGAGGIHDYTTREQRTLHIDLAQLGAVHAQNR